MNQMNVRPTTLDSDEKPEEDTDSSGEKDESLLLLVQRAKRSSQSSENKESEQDNADTSDENEAKLEEKPEPRSSVSAIRRPSAISISDYLASKAVQETIEAQRHSKKSPRRSSTPSKSSGRSGERQYNPLLLVHQKRNSLFPTSCKQSNFTLRNLASVTQQHGQHATVRATTLSNADHQDISVNTNISDDDDEGRKHTVLPIITRKFWVFCERHFHQKGTGYSTIRTHTNPYTIRLEKGYQGGTQHCIVCTDVHSWATCLKAVSTRQRRSVTYYVTNEVAPEKECNTTAASIWNRNKQLKFIRTPGRQVSLSAVVNSSHSSVMSFMFQRHEIIIMVASRIIMHGFWSSSKLAY
ncbi:hypothetical protein CLF_104963 [Clonorchis sinensis]|uniref:Uncharacterized protein n=1 Tax=Clonorchis sinensis TaxID=79923 RepID=G7YCP5_CLOSI|nr:hypothetical protein CLF_104963 [Clonorchis sinensis]